MIPVALLAVAALALAGVAAATAERPREPVPDLHELYDRWAALHRGFDPRANRWVRGWLALVYRLARPLARRGVQPDVLTLWSVWLALAVVAVAFQRGGWLFLAGLVLVVSALADALDGSVAALTQRATRWGQVLDALADRVGEVAYLVAVWLAGAPGWLAVAAGVAFGLHESVRDRAAGAGMPGIGAVTVGERPTRVVCCAGALLSAGLWPPAAAGLATLWLAVLAMLSVAGLGQLLAAVHRRLR